MSNKSETMHDLPPAQAILYWIPSICVAIGMFITLLCSFWKFHKRKLFIRQLQIDYLEVNLAAKRPRIGAIRCNTHGAKWEDLMASLTTSGYINMRNYLRQNSKLKSPRQYDIVYEENELSNNDAEISMDSSVKKSKTKHKEINPYYEQIGYVECEHKPQRSGSKKKKKKKPTLSLHSGTYDYTNKQENEFSTRSSSSPRRLPVMENDLWSGNSPQEHYQNNNERQRPSIYYATRFVQSNDVERPVTQPKPSPVPEHKRKRKEERRAKNAKREKHQEERVFWVLATDIMQSSV